MIPCPRCSASAPNVGTLAGHLATDHLISPSTALVEAQEAARAVTAAVTPTEKETPMGSSKADPASCKYCARFKPDKCKRHGGQPRSTAYKATGARKAAAPKGATNGHKPLSFGAQLDAVIERKRTELAQLEQAKIVLAGAGL